MRQVFGGANLLGKGCNVGRGLDLVLGADLMALGPGCCAFWAGWVGGEVGVANRAICFLFASPFLDPHNSEAAPQDTHNTAGDVRS